jgi:hypothetical protein
MRIPLDGCRTVDEALERIMPAIDRHIADREREIETALVTTIPQEMGVEAIDPDELEAGRAVIREWTARAREEFVAAVRQTLETVKGGTR